MTDRRLLYFTARGHDVYRAARGGPRLEASFAAAGVAEFRAYLRSHAGAVFSVLADLAGEDFQEDQIPFLRGAERKAVLGRRLAQRYRDTRLATALSLGYVKTERRNERLLLASFTEPQQFAPWLGAIAEAGAKLAGVYSVPLLAPALAARLGLRDRYALVATFTGAGLRQCFLDHGRLRFARLEQADDSTPEALAALLRAETARLAQYLTTLRGLPREGPPVQVAVVAPAGLTREIEHELDRTAAADDRFAFRVVGMDRALRAVGLRRPPPNPGAELLYLSLAAKTPPAEQFAQREERSSFFVWRMQRATVAAGALGLSVCALYAGGMWRETYDAREQTGQARSEARGTARQYELITATFPATHTSTENLKVTVAGFRRIAAQAASPEPVLAQLSRVLDRFPRIQVDTLTWNAARPEAQTGPEATGAAKDDSAESLEIAGRLAAAQRGDYRAIVAEVERLAQALRSMPGWQLARTRLPFDVTPEGVLTGDMRTGRTESEETRFSVQLTRAAP